MPEAKKSRRTTNAHRLRRLYAARPVVAHAEATAAGTISGVVPLINPAMQRYVRKDMLRTLITVGVFVIIFIVFYMFQDSPGVERAIDWVGLLTGF